MTIHVYKTGGRIARSVRGATLVAEIEMEPHEVPYNLTKLARKYGGDFAQIIPTNILLEELQPA